MDHGGDAAADRPERMLSSTGASMSPNVDPTRVRILVRDLVRQLEAAGGVLHRDLHGADDAEQQFLRTVPDDASPPARVGGLAAPNPQQTRACRAGPSPSGRRGDRHRPSTPRSPAADRRSRRGSRSSAIHADRSTGVSSGSIAISIATADPPCAITIRSPWRARSTSRENCVFASWMLNVRSSVDHGLTSIDLVKAIPPSDARRVRRSARAVAPRRRSRPPG